MMKFFQIELKVIQSLLLISLTSLLSVPLLSHSKESDLEITVLKSERIKASALKRPYVAVYCFDSKVFVANFSSGIPLNAAPFLVDSETGLNQASCLSEGFREVAKITAKEMRAQKTDSLNVFCVAGKKFYYFGGYSPPIQAIQNGKIIEC